MSKNCNECRLSKSVYVNDIFMNKIKLFILEIMND